MYTKTLHSAPGSIYQMWEITTPAGLHLCTVVGEQDATDLLVVLNSDSPKVSPATVTAS